MGLFVGCGRGALCALGLIGGSRLAFQQERALGGSGGLGGIGFHAVALGGSGIGSRRCATGQTRIQRLNFRPDVGKGICLPKFQIGTGLEQFAHTLRLFHARHFHHDAAGLSLQLLDIGLSHAKAVDTRAEHVIRIVDSVFHLGAQHLLHLTV